MNLTEPICIIGASMGGAVVCMFAIKYPEYVSMLCLLAPIANEECETDLIKQLRGGAYNALLPETPEQLRTMINTLTVKRIHLPGPFLNGFLHLRLRLLAEHKKILSSLLENDYPQIEQHYQQLRQLNRPALILWGRQDMVYAYNGADFFCNLLPNAKSVIFDDCGHFMAIDKPEETASSIVNFFDDNANDQIYLQLMGTASSVNSKPRSPYHRLCDAKVRKAKSMPFIDGDASNFYFLCSNGETDKVREILESPDRRSIDEFIKLERNGNTALHVATEKGHSEIVRLLLEHGGSRTILNRSGKVAAEEATTPEIQKLYIRCDSTDRFHENDMTKNMAIYLPNDNKANSATNETDVTNKGPLEYFKRFNSEEEVYNHSLDQQTTAMWLRFYNWFSRTFPSLFQRDNLHLEAFDLHNNSDFNYFLTKKLDKPKCKRTLEAIDKAQRENSINALLTIYTNEDTGFYKSLNKQLVDSPAEPDTSPHLCDRFIIEFHIRGDELASRAFIGTIYRGATINSTELSLYEETLKNKPRGVITFKAFTSTSEDKDKALGFAINDDPKNDRISILFIIKIKNKSPTILGIEDVSEYKNEKEVLVMPGNLFVVKKVEKDCVHYTKDQQKVTVTEIHLEYLHIPVSFWTKVRHTYQSANNSVM